ncbi:NADH dehydrogenase-like [Scleropages formosus]|uniref:NADH dehydrogenase-like n=1 Tax=Scleropages formosus TaxID=113540 RepID=A0A0P7YKS2_SCLFO|nr:NADH dehydrogenase-like [Scleropages formosus]
MHFRVGQLVEALQVLRRGVIDGPATLVHGVFELEAFVMEHGPEPLKRGSFFTRRKRSSPSRTFSEAIPEPSNLEGRARLGRRGRAVNVALGGCARWAAGPRWSSLLRAGTGAGAALRRPLLLVLSVSAASPAASSGPAGSMSMSMSMNVFDRSMKRRQKGWAAALRDRQQFEYLRDEVGSRVADRVYDVSRTFPLALDVGCGRSHIAEHLNKDFVERLFLTEISEDSLVSHVRNLPDLSGSRSRAALQRHYKEQ